MVWLCNNCLKIMIKTPNIKPFSLVQLKYFKSLLSAPNRQKKKKREEKKTLFINYCGVDKIPKAKNYNAKISKTKIPKNTAFINTLAILKYFRRDPPVDHVAANVLKKKHG